MKISQIIQMYGLLKNKERSKSFGQNFLTDENLLDKIVSYAGDLENVFEVGPGPGGLTRAILKKNPKKLVCIEKDRNCLHALQPLAAIHPCLTVIHADALQMSPQDLLPVPIKIISNLPYNVGTKLLTNWLFALHQIDILVLMFQKEVALRIIAKENDPHYGRLSILSALTCERKMVMHIPPTCFFPAPKVDSALVCLKPLHRYDYATLKKVETITRAAFSQKRKMLKSSLSQILFKKPLQVVLQQCSINPNARAETLPPEVFVALSRFL